MTLALRIGLAVAALALAVLLVPGLRSARDQARATAIAGRATPADVPEIDRLLRAAGDRTRSTDADLLRGQLYLFASRPGDAARVAEQVAREEPENHRAWALLAQATQRSDPRRSAQARARYRALSPSVPPPR